MHKSGKAFHQSRSPNKKSVPWHKDPRYNPDTDPECEVCGEQFNPARKALGIDTCLEHGAARKEYTAVPVPKSNYVIATSPEQVLSPYSHKGTR